MKIFNIEAVDMGNDQQEIADWVMNHIGDTEFENEEAFQEQEGSLIHLACESMEWNSVPQVGGLIAEWATAPVKLTKGWGDGGQSMRANYSKLT
tara:strand:+ start:239 stop:520 length:282 start_codon:yes stop_codon:yes gene_type:complete